MSIQRNRKKVLSVLITAFIIISAGLAAPLLSRNILTTGVQAQGGGNKQYIPFVNNPAPVPNAGDWTQHAHDALHTSYTTQVVPTPWRWKWSWNGPTPSGGVISGKIRIPRNIQPVTGGGRVYIAAGTNGIFALDSGTGAQVWNVNPGGVINSTPAYDSASNALIVVSSNGRLYRLNASTGQTIGEFNAQSSSTLPLPPALYGDRIYFSMGNKVFAINRVTMGEIWAYDAGSPVHTPPAFSPSTGLVIAASEDLYVHAIRNADGTQSWRVKPTPLTPGDPGKDTNFGDVKFGWPVIADSHGLVLIRFRLDWETLWTWNPWPGSNSQMRANLAARPDQQALYVLRLSNGSTAFKTNVGNGGFGDSNYLNMGPQPVIKQFNDGSEVAYVVMRGRECTNNPCDGRYDSHLGEMPLDSTTVPGFQAGDVRFIQNSFFPTDEQVRLTMAGDFIFGGHWMFGIAHQIQNRAADRGASSGTPITTSNLPHFTNSSTSCPFSSSHYCPKTMIQDGDPRAIPAGFYIYYNQTNVYFQYWSDWSIWVVSGNTIYFTSDDGALIALENGSPLQSSSSSETPDLQNAPAPVLDEPIPYTSAREFAGSIATVEGQIKFLFNNRKAVTIGFENPHGGAFKAIINKADWPNFDAQPETLYSIGQSVRVRGLIDWYQGDPAIYVQTPDQIEVVSEVSTVTGRVKVN